LTLIRSIFSVLFILATQNVNLKANVWDNIKCNQIPALLFRALQGSTSVMLTYYCITIFSVTVIGITESMQAMVVVILAWVVLNEKLGIFSIVLLIIGLLSASLVIIGSPKEIDSDLDLNEESATNGWPVVALAINPVLLAAGAISMRMIKKLPEATVSWYLNVALGLVSLVFIAIAKGSQDPNDLYYGFCFMSQFDTVSWILSVLIGVNTVFVNTSKFAAIKRRPPSELQIYNSIPRIQ
jgi:drug/metabolite transporter (DMT)-like permease